jgi:hypothetical protein
MVDTQTVVDTLIDYRTVIDTLKVVKRITVYDTVRYVLDGYRYYKFVVLSKNLGSFIFCVDLLPITISSNE